MVRKIIGSIQLLLVVVFTSAQGNFMFNQHGFLSAEIDTNTYINIFFDNSGTMSATETPLDSMVSTYLKDSLILFYNNDETIYNSRVNIYDFSDVPNAYERTFVVLNYEISEENLSSGKRIINIAYQDESTPYGASSGFPATPATDYLEDLSAILDSTSYFINTIKYTGIVFQVSGFSGFKSFLEAVYDGTGNYSGTNGLSDRQDQFAFYYDINDGDTAEYYINKLMTALRDLGFNL